jgi:hypothetical protein
LALLVGEIDETQAKTDGPHVMRNLTRQLEAVAVRELDLKAQPFTDHSFAGRVDKTAALGEVGDARGTVSMSVPNGIERNVYTLLAPALVHIQF